MRKFPLASHQIEAILTECNLNPDGDIVLSSKTLRGLFAALTQRAVAEEQRAAASELLLQGLILDPTLPEHLRANAHKVLEAVLRVTKERDSLRRKLAEEREACAAIAFGSRSATPHHQICEYIGNAIRARANTSGV